MSTTEDPANITVGTEPCPKCHSPDNFKRFADGHGHCFSAGCGYHEKAKPEGRSIPTRARRGPQPSASVELLAPDASQPAAVRGIKRATRQRCGVFQATYQGQAAQVYPEYHQGQPVGQKLRLPDKRFPVLKGEHFPGGLNDCDIWGMWVFGDRFDRKVVITEGEEDAMAIMEVTNFKIAVVSVTAGASAAKACLQANWRWLDRFQDIILWLDDDEPGRAAMDECVRLFSISKLRVANAPGFKDANEALMAGKPGDIEAAIYMARNVRLKGVVNARDCLPDMEQPLNPVGWQYPWPKLTTDTYGIHRGTVAYFVAGTSIGKSTIFNHVQYHLLEQDVKIGRIGFEESRTEAQLALMSIKAKRRLDLRPLPKAELVALHKQVFGSGNVELFDQETAEWSFDAMLSYVRYMAQAQDCVAISLDPLTAMLAAVLQFIKDERQALDKISWDLAQLSKELNVALLVAHHLSRPPGSERPHEEGGRTHLNQVRGSGGIANFANFVFGVERNLQGEHKDLSLIRILKSRKPGITGPSSVVQYDPLTGDLIEVDQPWPDPEEQGKKRGRGGRAFTAKVGASDEDDAF